MMLVGVLLLTGWWDVLMATLRHWTSNFTVAI